MTEEHKFQLGVGGTVVEGTMQAQDVLPAIMDVLVEHHPEAHQEIVGIVYGEFNTTYTELRGQPRHPAWETEFMGWLLNEVAWEAMNDIAPKGYYFGAHPGDGADHGFWQLTKEVKSENHGD